MNLVVCITELPCPYQKDMEGIGCCMKDEGCCEYQLLEDNEDGQSMYNVCVKGRGQH